jgi:hypothetical protein
MQPPERPDGGIAVDDALRLAGSARISSDRKWMMTLASAMMSPNFMPSPPLRRAGAGWHDGEGNATNGLIVDHQLIVSRSNQRDRRSRSDGSPQVRAGVSACVTPSDPLGKQHYNSWSMLRRSAEGACRSFPVRVGKAHARWPVPTGWEIARRPNSEPCAGSAGGIPYWMECEAVGGTG